MWLPALGAKSQGDAVSSGGVLGTVVVDDALVVGALRVGNLTPDLEETVADLGVGGAHGGDGEPPNGCLGIARRTEALLVEKADPGLGVLEAALRGGEQEGERLRVVASTIKATAPAPGVVGALHVLEVVGFEGILRFADHDHFLGFQRIVLHDLDGGRQCVGRAGLPRRLPTVPKQEQRREERGLSV